MHYYHWSAQGPSPSSFKYAPPLHCLFTPQAVIPALCVSGKCVVLFLLYVFIFFILKVDSIVQNSFRVTEKLDRVPVYPIPSYPVINIYINVVHMTLFFKKILFIFREMGKEREREGQKHQCVIVSFAPPTGRLAHNPGMCPAWESNWQPFSLQASAQYTEPHQSGHIQCC